MPTGVYKRTTEHNKKISELQKGRKLSEETKKKISLSLKGKPKPKRTEEHIKNLSSSLKGRESPNKGKIFSKEYRKKLSLARIGRFKEENSPRWKGGGKVFKHKWITNIKGKAENYICVICKEKKAQDWSNKDHKYKKVLEDWQPVCKSCHFKFDIKFNNRKYLNN